MLQGTSACRISSNRQMAFSVSQQRLLFRASDFAQMFDGHEEQESARGEVEAVEAARHEYAAWLRRFPVMQAQEASTRM